PTSEPTQAPMAVAGSTGRIAMAVPISIYPACSLGPNTNPSTADSVATPRATARNATPTRLGYAMPTAHAATITSANESTRDAPDDGASHVTSAPTAAWTTAPTTNPTIQTRPGRGNSSRTRSRGVDIFDIGILRSSGVLFQENLPLPR